VQERAQPSLHAVTHPITVAFSRQIFKSTEANLVSH
jgi:hypothetical protein